MDKRFGLKEGHRSQRRFVFGHAGVTHFDVVRNDLRVICAGILSIYWTDVKCDEDCDGQNEALQRGSTGMT